MEGVYSGGGFENSNEWKAFIVVAVVLEIVTNRRHL